MLRRFMSTKKPQVEWKDVKNEWVNVKNECKKLTPLDWFALSYCTVFTLHIANIFTNYVWSPFDPFYTQTNQRILELEEERKRILELNTDYVWKPDYSTK